MGSSFGFKQGADSFIGRFHQLGGGIKYLRLGFDVDDRFNNVVFSRILALGSTRFNYLLRRARNLVLDVRAVVL